MAFIFDEVNVNNGQLIVAENGSDVKSSGVKQTKHSAYIEGPVQVGNVSDFTSAEGTVMIGKDGNAGAAKALSVKGDIDQDGNIVTTGTINTNGSRINVGFVNGTGASVAVKAFDIEHPSKSGYRLRHICLEGPESAVYYRGRLKNQKKIVLPKYWKDLVDIDSITVQLQSIGVHQDIIVKRWDDENIFLQSQGALPINCFFHVYAERKDVEKLIPEYEGTSIDDYPGDNSVYSINK